MKTDGPIIITGFMGCGKTEVARRLAERLGLSVIDLDDAITERVGRSPAQLIAADGESTFRIIEARVLDGLLSSLSLGVISLGGGAWIEEQNREAIAKAAGQTVWLDTPFDVCWQRIEASGDDRPLGKSKEQAFALYERRCPIYQLATIRIAARAMDSVDELASRVEDEISHPNK
jgi:shikimate kinase